MCCKCWIPGFCAADVTILVSCLSSISALVTGHPVLISPAHARVVEGYMLGQLTSLSTTVLALIDLFGEEDCSQDLKTLFRVWLERVEASQMQIAEVLVDGGDDLPLYDMPAAAYNQGDQHAPPRLGGAMLQSWKPSTGSVA